MNESTITVSLRNVFIITPTRDRRSVQRRNRTSLYVIKELTRKHPPGIAVAFREGIEPHHM